MIFAQNLLSIFLIFIASTDGWIFRIKCGMTGWPSNWQHGSTGPVYDTQIYRCSVTVEPSGNLTGLVAVVGDHLEGKTNSDIQLIEINNSSTFTSIPSNIGNLLPDLIGIDFRAELIRTVTAEDLKQFPNLTYLAIYVSPIVSLDGDLLKYTPHIQVLIVPSNKIVNVGANLLENLEDLKFVNFLSNPCLSYYASNPEQLDRLKRNLPLRCPPILTTTTTATKPPIPPTAPKPTTTVQTSTSTTTTHTPTQTNPSSTPTKINPTTPTQTNPITTPTDTNPITTPTDTNPTSTPTETNPTTTTQTNPTTPTHTDPTTSTETNPTPTLTETIPTSTPTETNPTSTPTETNPTSTPAETNPTTPTSTVPVDDCKICCSLNEETDELKNELIYQGTLIRNLYGIMSDYSQRIFELEKINEKLARAAKAFSCLV